jgi:hypothetical protein
MNHPHMFNTSKKSIIEVILNRSMAVNDKQIGIGVSQTIAYILAAMFTDDKSREVIV